MGNWFTQNGQVDAIHVSDMGNEDYALLVAIHELIEAHLCTKRGISEESVTDFDLEYEGRRREGDNSEPGDDSRAPYHREHVFATIIERAVAAELEVDWEEYEKAIYAL